MAWRARSLASAALPDDERDLSTAAGVARALAAYAPLLDAGKVARASLTTGVRWRRSRPRRSGSFCGAAGGGGAAEALRRAGDQGGRGARRGHAGHSRDAGLPPLGRRGHRHHRAQPGRRLGRLGPAAGVRAAAGAAHRRDGARRRRRGVGPRRRHLHRSPDDRPAPLSIASMDLGERLGWITHPAVRWDVARSLAGSDAPEHVPALRLALHRLPAAECARLAAELLSHGDALTDLWVELLSSPRPALAGIGATVAGLLRLRRALTPLVQRALSPAGGRVAPDGLGRRELRPRGGAGGA